MRFEIDWGYVFNAEAGEQIYLLMDDQCTPSELDGLKDFWLFDNKTMFLMQYDEDGRFERMLLETDPQTVPMLSSRASKLLNRAVTLKQFLSDRRKHQS